MPHPHLQTPIAPTASTATRPFSDLLAAAIKRRSPLLRDDAIQALRLFGGAADGIDGIFIDRYGPGCVLILYEGRVPGDFQVMKAAKELLAQTAELGVTAIYLKPFAKDRSRLGGNAPAVLTDPTPAAGEPLDEAIVIRERNCRFEVRLFDSFSTGLFSDQRDNRRFLASWLPSRREGPGEGSPRTSNAADRSAATPPLQVLNTFAYTCAFSISCALAGALTTSVDISPKYLDWGKRNFAHNGIDPTLPDTHRFAKMDTFEFFRYARRKKLTYDLIILDPPSFSTANKKKKIPAWSSTEHYGKLIHEAAALLRPKGAIFASTNTRELCLPGRFDREIKKALGKPPRYIELPPPPIDFAREQDRFAARMFIP